jgi:hypothetical protein
MDEFYVGHKVGRVMEGRPLVLKTVEGARRYCDEFRHLLRAQGTPSIVCADYRAVEVFPPAVVDELQRLMTEMNPFVERAAVLVSPEHPTNAMQVQRVVRETEHPGRRRFTSVAEAAAYLAEVLTREETERVQRFLSEAPVRRDTAAPPPRSSSHR